jgi:hypothetical protein
MAAHEVDRFPSINDADLDAFLEVIDCVEKCQDAWNICHKVLGMTKGFIARGHRPSAIEPLVIPRTKGKCSSLLNMKPLNNRFIT